MSNNYFAFKQFVVWQEACAMKVSTDACIQGAWTPLPDGIGRVLDIGTGTGLLSLMLAQRLPEAQFDAIELDASAAGQASQNVAASPFANRIAVRHADANTWEPRSLYDLIICNPPFFSNSLKGPHAARNAARHTDALKPQSLIETLLRNLSTAGTASILLPPAEHEGFHKLSAVSGLYLQQFLQVRDREESRITRHVGIYSTTPAHEVPFEELHIKNPDGSYTPAFMDLLRPFYLNL